MEKHTAGRILQAQEYLLENEEYRALLAEHEMLNARFLHAVEGLDQESKAAIFDYIGLLTELHTKILISCCE